MKNQILSLLILFTLVFLFTGCASKNDSQNSSEVPSVSVEDTQAEDNSTSAYPNTNTFNAETIDGKKFTQDDLSGYDVTAINMWSTTCYYCIEEMPQLAEFQKELPKNVQLITFCLDGQQAPDEAKQILDECGFEGTTLVSGDGDIISLASEIMYVPTTVFVDSKGNIVGTEIIGGSQDVKAVFTDHFNKALSQLGKDTMQ